MYSRMISHSAIGFPWCKKTGTFLWMGLYLRSKGLLLDKSSSTLVRKIKILYLPDL